VGGAGVATGVRPTERSGPEQEGAGLTKSFTIYRLREPTFKLIPFERVEVKPEPLRESTDALGLGEGAGARIAVRAGGVERGQAGS
jgi:hypothetical protein